ncbi:MAG: ATP-binding protein [Bacteroidales bacterium]|nr:ATP-binding protein [Bacteroidales bacterium]
MKERIIKKQIKSSLKQGSVIALFGARRTGKTVLMKKIMNELSEKTILYVQGDDFDISEILSSQRLSLLKSFVYGYDYLFVDEAQKISNIGQNLKLLTDNVPELSIFITGSSALDLRQKVGEPLTGRSVFYYLFPFSQKELNEDFLTAKRNIETKLIYGMYPQVIMAETVNDRIDVLTSIKNGYLLKDVLELDNLKDTKFILNLLRLIAFQIGNDISYSELASNLNVNKKTVQRYLDILEKIYVIFSLPGFSRNLRKEYSKTPRYYFWDNGIRNILISNFNNINLRDDIGKLWENFCISERLKFSHYNSFNANYFFWRTYDQKEIDLIEEKDGFLNAYEFKWKNKKVKPPKLFTETYKKSEFFVINPENWLNFIS